MTIPPEYFCTKRPGIPIRIAGFFVCLVCVLLFLSSCGTGRKMIPGPETTIFPGVSGIDEGIDDEKADSLFMEGVKAKILGKNEDAINYFRKFSLVRPRVAAPHYEVARLILANYFNPTGALDEIKKAVRLDSTNKWMQSFYADLLAYSGSYEEAALINEKLALKQRYPEEYWMKEVMLYQKAGKTEEALNVLDKLERYTSMDKESIMLFRHQIYQEKGDDQLALNEARKLVAESPDELRYLLLLANSLEKVRNKEEAGEVFKKVEREYGDEPDVQYVLLEHYLDLRDTARINLFFKKAMSNELLSKDEKNNLLMLLMQYEQSEPEVKGITEQTMRYMAMQEPADATAIGLYADYLSVSKKPDDALLQYKKLVTLDPSRQEAWLQILYIYARPETADSLVYYGGKAVSRFPENGLAQYLLGLGYQFTRNYSQSAAAIKKAIELQPGAEKELKAQMLILLGDTYNNLKNYTASDSCYEQAIGMEPDNASALNNYSYYLSERGERLDEAEKMSARSLKIQPTEATFLDTYGWILYQKGDYQEAKKYIQRAIDNTTDPDGTLWEHLGDVEYKLNNRTKALDSWRKAKAKGGASEKIESKIKEHE